jgi:chemotaxis protein methyltransferase CheR
MLLTDREYEKFVEFIYNQTGIHFDLRKNTFISKRITSRLENLGEESFTKYFDFLRYKDFQKIELQELVNLLTINESYFFRDFPQIESFANYCLTEVAERNSAEDNFTIRIWSAGCSSGDEPYTLAIILSEILDFNHWKIEVHASDIDLTILDKAKKGIYEERSIRDVPLEYLAKYFVKSGNKYKVNDKIKSMVQFEHLNLSDIKSMRLKRNFDFIFCRNVLIYFDELSRKKVIDNFFLSLNSGGYIFLGSSESINRITTAFTIKKKGAYLVYTKD